MAQEKAARAEAEHFDTWVALDAEISALEHRRDRLRESGAGGPA